MRNYGIGPKKDVKYLTRNAAVENRYTSIKFRAGMGSSSGSGGGGGSSGGGGSNVVSELNFGSTTATSSALVVASGPRVELYRNNLTRALRAEGSTQKRRQMKFYDDDDDDDFDDEFDGGDDVLFGGRGRRKSKTVSADGYDSIDPDRNISTGGLLSACAAFRSDSKLIAIGSEGGVVRICDANSRATLRTFHSSNKEGGGGGGGGGDRKTIRSVAWLRDGKRVVAGGDDGLVRVWNVGGATSGGSGSGAEMTLRGHGDKVTSIKVVSFRADDLRSKSKEKRKGATNDATTVATASSIITHTAPSDDAFDSPVWSSYVVSASYDHTLRVWDIESNSEARGQDRCISIMNHGDPIQALLVLPPANNRSYSYGGSGGGESNRKSSKLDNLPLVVSAGGTTLKVWNILNGSCLGTYPTKHAKTITALCLLDVPYDSSEEVEEDGSGTRRKRHIITAGLDGLLRVHSASNEDILSGSLPYLHGMQITEPISALAVSSDMNRIAIGTTTGFVMVYQRRRVLFATAAPASSTTMAAKEPRHGTYSYFTRGANEKSNDPDDYMLMHQKKQKLAEYDLLLRKFRYGDALDAVLAKRQPQAVIAVIEELGKRCGLTIALSNRDEESLDAILSFTTRFIDNPQYTSHLIGVAHILCDIYGSLLGQSAVVDELFAKLRAKVAMECAVQKMLLRLVGQIDYVMNTAEILAAKEEMQKHS